MPQRPESVWQLLLGGLSLALLILELVFLAAFLQ